MKRMILIAALALFAAPVQASYYHVPRVPPVKTPLGPGNQTNGNWHVCPTPAGIFICIVGGMIIVDEVKKAMEGKCATMQPRRSWFGMTPDEPRLWKPLCNFKPDPISTRG